MSNQVIHKVGICLLARSFILLIAVSGCVGTKAPLDLLEGQSSGGPSSSLIWTTTRAPDVAPAPPNQKLVEQTLSTTRPPSVGATRLGKGNKYEIVSEGKRILPPGIREDPGQYRIIPHSLGSGASVKVVASSSESTEDAEDILETFINSTPDLNNNLDVITQAFRFVKLDAHLAALVNQLSKLQQSHEELQGMTVKQETKFDILAQEMKSLAHSLSSESVRLKEVEARIENEITTMNQRLESAVEKIIKSSTVSQFLTDMSKESLQQLDKVETLTEKVLGEIKSVQTELGDVGQASVQVVYNVQKTEENIMTAMAGLENRTIYALRQESVPTQQSTIKGNSSEEIPSIMADSNGLESSAAVSLGSFPRATTSSDEEEDGGYRGTTLSCYPGGRRRMKGKPMDCSELQISGVGSSSSGVYKIYPFSDPNRGVEVYCDMETDGGGWTVIQRRSDQKEIPRKNFYRPWNEYEKGFGSPADHVWLGLSTLAELTVMGDQELKIELMDWEGNLRFANYGYFRIANGTDRYRLHITDYAGTAGDSMAYHNGMQFSTKDMDNDLERSVNCAHKYHGGWWYKNCHQANLNGQYMDKGGKHVSYAMGINWYSWHGYYYSLKKTEMKIRNRHFTTSIRKTIQGN